MRLSELPNLVQRFWANVIVSDGCWAWASSKSRDGYGKISVNIEGRCKSLRAHRVSWEIHNGPIPEGLLVCHHCDNPECTNPDHLFLGTVKDNSEDMVAKGRSVRGSKRAPDTTPRGEKNSHAILTEDDVRYIRQLYHSDATQTTIRLAAQFGVQTACISKIVLRHSWKHVK